MNINRILQKNINFDNFQEILTIALIKAKKPRQQICEYLKYSTHTYSFYKNKSQYNDMQILSSFSEDHLYIPDYIFNTKVDVVEKFILLILNWTHQIKIETLIDKYNIPKYRLQKTLKTSILFNLSNNILTINPEAVSSLNTNTETEQDITIQSIIKIVKNGIAKDTLSLIQPIIENYLNNNPEEIQSDDYIDLNNIVNDINEVQYKQEIIQQDEDTMKQDISIKTILLTIKQKFKNNEILKDDLLEYTKEVLKHYSFNKDDLTLQHVEVIKSFFIPPTKPNSVTQDKYKSWNENVDTKLEMWLENFDEEIELPSPEELLSKKKKNAQNLNEDGEVLVYGSMSEEEHERMQAYAATFRRVH